MKLLITIISVLAFCSSLRGAAYEELGTVRPLGMGEAFEAVSAGLDSIRYNPAGTAYLKSLQFYGSFSIPAMGFDDETSMNTIDAGLAFPFSAKPNLLIKDATIAFMFHQFTVADFAYERLFAINLAKSLNNLFEGANLAIGANLNIFNRGFTATEDTLVHPDYLSGNLANSVTGLGVDLGLTYDFSRFIRLAFVMANLLEPNISFFKDGTEKVNQEMKVGLAWNMENILFMHNFLLGADLVQISRDSSDIRKAETVYKFGLEFWEWDKRLGFRFGYKSLLNVFTAGFSFRQFLRNGHSFMINYAFNYPMDTLTYKHAFSLNYQLDFPDYYFDYTTAAQVEEENREIEDNYRKGLVIVKYKTLPNDNLYNIALIHYGAPDKAEVLKKFNKIEDEKNLPVMMDVPYDAKSFELYKVQATDSLEVISLKFYGTDKEIGKIRRFNKIDFSKLRPGRILVIPITAVEKEQYKLKGDAMDNLKKANESRNQEYEKLLTDLRARTGSLTQSLMKEYNKAKTEQEALDKELAGLEKSLEKEKDPLKKTDLGDKMMNVADKKTKNINDINSRIKQANVELEKIKADVIKGKDKADRTWKDSTDRNLNKAGTDFSEIKPPDLETELSALSVKLPVIEVPLKPNKPQPKPSGTTISTNKPQTKPVPVTKSTNKPQPKPTTVTKSTNKPQTKPVPVTKSTNKPQPKPTGTGTSTKPKGTGTSGPSQPGNKSK